MDAAINVGISICLVRKYGLVGVAVRTLVANAFRTFLYVYYISRSIIMREMRQVIQ